MAEADAGKQEKWESMLGGAQPTQTPGAEAAPAGVGAGAGAGVGAGVSGGNSGNDNSSGGARPRKVLRERRVPESPIGRAMGFAGTGGWERC